MGCHWTVCSVWLVTSWDVEYPWRDLTTSYMGTGALMLRTWLKSITRHTTSCGSWGFMRFLCLRHVPLLRCLNNVPRRDSTLVNTYLDKVARGVNIMPRSIMIKGSRGRRVSELSCACLFLFNFASFDNCGDSQAPVANFLCLVSGYELATATLTSSSVEGKTPQGLEWPPLSWLRSKPCFLWRADAVPPYGQVVHPDLTPHYLVMKHKWSCDTNGAGAHAYSPAEGRVSRWMVDAWCLNWRFHLIWRRLLLVVPSNDHLGCSIMLKQSPGLKVHRVPIAPPSSCLRDLWLQEASFLGAAALPGRPSQKELLR